jgi:hypothetical protein
LLLFLLIIAFICAVSTKTDTDNNKNFKDLSIGFIIGEIIIVVALVVLERLEKNAVWIISANMLLLLFSMIYVITYSTGQYSKCDKMSGSYSADYQACRDFVSSNKGSVYDAFVCGGILALVWQILFWILIGINCCYEIC